MTNEEKSHLLDILRVCAETYGVKLEETQTTQFFRYCELLKEWNEKFNLTAITDDREIFIKHFADSLSIAPHLEGLYDSSTGEKHYKAVDVGTGAGFPAIPLKISFPSLNMTLIDALNKRIGFLNEAARELGLDGIEAVHLRAEEGGRDKNYRGKFDFCFSRAVARLNILAEFCLPLIKTGGIFIAMKGADCVEEVEEAGTAVRKLGGEIEKVCEIVLPFSEIRHTNIIIKKVRQTPPNLPRTYNQMIKNPIK